MKPSRRKQTLIASLILFALSSLVVAASAQTPFDSWAKIDILSFNGDNIQFSLQIYVKGDHANDMMQIHGEFSSGSAVSLDVGRGLSDVVFNSGTNITIFSYSYAYNQTYYRATPKLFGLLDFPNDKHELIFFITPSFNLKLDEHVWMAKVPSSNYEGTYSASPSPTTEEPSRYQLAVEIEHPSPFKSYTSLLLYVTIGSLYILSLILTSIVVTAYWKKIWQKAVVKVLPSSWAAMLFVPVFEISLQNLKTPLTVVFSDIFLFAIIPWNAAIIVVSVLILRREANSSKSNDESKKESDEALCKQPAKQENPKIQEGAILALYAHASRIWNGAVGTTLTIISLFISSVSLIRALSPNFISDNLDFVLFLFMLFYTASLYLIIRVGEISTQIQVLENQINLTENDTLRSFVNEKIPRLKLLHTRFSSSQLEEISEAKRPVVWFIRQNIRVIILWTIAFAVFTKLCLF